MEIIPLTNQERTNGFTHRARITHADLTEATANTAQVIPLYAGKKGTTVVRVATLVHTKFENSADSAHNTTTLTIGDTGSAARFLASQELNENGTEVLAKAGTGTLHTYVAPGSAAVLNATFGSQSTKKLADIDTGSLDIYFAVAELADLD